MLNVWLRDDGRLSSLFPSYLLRALNISNVGYTKNIQDATVIIGGRNLGLLPEHFSGQVLGAGLDRKMVRTFPLMKTVFLLGHKTGECILSRADNSRIAMGDPLLLADLVLERLAVTPISKTGKPGLLVVGTAEEAQMVSSWSGIKTAQEQKELEVISVAEQKQGVLELLDKIYGRAFVVATDPDIVAVATSFNLPCAPATLASGDIFVWRDFYSVLFGEKMIPMVRRLKADLKLKDLVSWCAGKTIPVGDLKLAKAQIQHHFQVLKGGAAAATAPARKPRSRSLTRKPAAPLSDNLSRTMSFKPAVAQQPLQLSWLQSSAASPAALPPLSTKSLPAAAAPPIPAAAPTPVSTRSETHVRSRSSAPGRKIFSVATPRD